MTQVIDGSVLDELAETVGADFVVELIDTFLSEAPGLVSELQTASQVGDAEAVRRAAHSIKSNANTFGAADLADAARVIELEGLDTSAPQTLKALISALDAASAALKARRDA